MGAKINLENLNPKRKVDLIGLENITGRILRMIGEGSSEVNVIFLSDQKIRAFNRKYFGKDSSTDVISFPSGEYEVSGGKKKKGVLKNNIIGKYVFLGDIAISTDTALKNAAVYGLTFLEEIVLYIIHGILHLVGYEDTSVKKKINMKEKENELFQKIRKFIQ